MPVKQYVDLSTQCYSNRRILFLLISFDRRIIGAFNVDIRDEHTKKQKAFVKFCTDYFSNVIFGCPTRNQNCLDGEQNINWLVLL